MLGLVGASSLAAVAGCLGGGGGDAVTTTESTTTTDATTTSDGSMDGPTVTVASHPDHGDVLVDAQGMTLYVFSNDSEGETVCYDSCAEAWPPLTVDGEPTAGDGVSGELGTVERDDGSTQVTIEGMPLYYFASDEEPGDATGQGINDVWWVVRPGGTAVPSVRVSSHDEHGDILTDAHGNTLYLFTNDSGGESACYDSCAEAWPPLAVDGEPTAGDGVSADLGTTERDDGSTQVTAAGHPLYYFASDEEPGDATGQGVNDVWYVLAPDGSQIGGTMATTTTASDGGGDTTTEDDGPSY